MSNEAHERGIEAATNILAEYLNAKGDFLDVGVEEAISAYLEASGLVLVPRDPSKEMIQAGNDKIDECIDFWNYDGDTGYSVESCAANRTFEAMLAVAPQPFSQPNTEGK